MKLTPPFPLYYHLYHPSLFRNFQHDHLQNFFWQTPLKQGVVDKADEDEAHNAHTLP